MNELRDKIAAVRYSGTTIGRGVADAKAQSVTLHLDLDGKELRETVYVTNRNNENFYVDKTDKTKRHPLPGWTAIDDICLLTTQDGLNEQVDETKTIKLYDADAKKETNQEVPDKSMILSIF